MELQVAPLWRRLRIREELRVFASIPAFASEEDFLHSLPNSENRTLPSLMLVKMRMLGLRAAVLYGYFISVIIAGLVGLMGIRRYATPD